MESNLEQLKNLLSSTLNKCDNMHFKLSDIPDLVTPPETHRDNFNETNETKDTNESNETNETKDTNESNEPDTTIKEDILEQMDEVVKELNTCVKLVNENDLFIMQTTNIMFSLLLCNCMLNLFYDFNRSNLSLFIFNSLMYLFYNSNVVQMVETQIDIINNSGKYFRKLLSTVNAKLYYYYSLSIDYLLSKNTQMILKFAYNVTKMKVITSYKNYRDRLFNPTLISQTNKDNVYRVSFYYNGETYYIPVVVPRFSFDKKQQPLMILNKNEDDVTSNILKYMGPNNDFYGMVLKPGHLNEKSLNFMLEDGSETNILENDMMVL
jgi:hypothetical protein